MTADDAPRNTWYDYKGSTTPYDMLFEAQREIGEIEGIFISWLARQSTCEYMLWNQLVELYQHNEIKETDSPYSRRGVELHNLLASGATEPVDPVGEQGNHWRAPDSLHQYQAERLASPYNGRVTEYSLMGEIDGLKVRGTMDAFELMTGTVIEIKTRAKPTIPYYHEKKNKMQVLGYYFLLEEYDTSLNCPDFPVEALSDRAKIEYYYQEDSSLLGLLIIHLPYERDRFFNTMRYFKQFWTGERPPRYSFKYCRYCTFKESCFFYQKYYREDFKKNR